MRYDVKKFLFVGSQYDKTLFFQKAQEAGLIHFIDPKDTKTQESSPEEQRIIHAIKIVRTLPVVEQEDLEEYPIANTLAQTIINLKSTLNTLAEDERMLKLEISRVEIFGDFSPDEMREIQNSTKLLFQFFCAKQGTHEHPSLPEELIYIGSDHGLDYFTAVNKIKVQYPKMIEIIIDKPLGPLKKELALVQHNIHSNEAQLKAFAKYNTFLHHALTKTMNDHHLEKATNCAEFPLQEELFVVEGWVPMHKFALVEKLVQQMHVFIEEVEIEPTETIPTYLENNKIAKMGEDLISIYDTPSNKDKDPSVWVLFFFALFFSMIIGDGGYGLILLAIALYIRYKHSAIQGMKKRVLNLVTLISFCCIVWGVLTTSFFGITIAPDNPVRKVSMMSWLAEKKAEYHMARHDAVYKEWVKKFPAVQNAKNGQDFLTAASAVNTHGKVAYEAYNKFADQIMMELALLIGIIHVIISMSRYLDRNLINLGWIIFIIGAYLYLPSFLDTASIANFAFGINQQIAAKNGIYMMYTGIAIAVVVAIFKHKWLGLVEASTVIQIFGDILSYLRLYALGLAGSLLTATMIDLAASVPFVFGVLILIFGHAVNIVLGIMGGVIHGLRLNFLEWYHYSFEGGGKMFNPLKKHEIE